MRFGLRGIRRHSVNMRRCFFSPTFTPHSSPFQRRRFSLEGHFANISLTLLLASRSLVYRPWLSFPRCRECGTPVNREVAPKDATGSELDGHTHATSSNIGEEPDVASPGLVWPIRTSKLGFPRELVAPNFAQILSLSDDFQATSTQQMSTISLDRCGVERAGGIPRQQPSK